MNKLRIVAALFLTLCLPVYGTNQKATKGFTIAVGDHFSMLSWNASTSTVVGYKVYRGSVSGGPYTSIATLGNVLTYTDHQVQPGTTYFWVITAYDASNESAYSSQVSGTIPQ